MFEVLVNTIVPLFALIGIGFVMGRGTLLPPAAARGVALMVTYVAIPALLFRSMAHADLRHNFDAAIVLTYFGVCAIIMGIALTVGRVLFGLGMAQLGIFSLGAMYSNSVLLGLPLVKTAFGDSGVVLLTKIIALHSLILLPLASFLVLFGRRGAEEAGRSAVVGSLRPMARALWQSLNNPVVLGLVAGLLWSLTGWDLPVPVERTCAMLSDAASPFALLALGASQARIPLVGNLGQPAVATAIKLAIHPLLVWLVASTFGGLSAEAIAVATVTAALPTGTNVYLLAQQYDCHVPVSASTVVLSTGFAALTLTIIVSLLKATL